MIFRQWLRRIMMMVVLAGSAAVFASAGLVAVPGQPLAQDFNLPARDGDRHRLLDYRGRYVLVNFWAGWCPPCIRELPSLQRTYTALRKHNFEVLAIHAGPELPNVRELLERFEITFPVLFDTELALGDWNVTGLPTSFLLDPEGRLIYQATGSIDWDELAQRELLEQLLDSDAGAIHKVPPAVMR